MHPHVDHQQEMMALIMGVNPPFALPKRKQQACPPAGLSSSLAASAARSSTEAASEHVEKSRKTEMLVRVHKTPCTESSQIFRHYLPISRASCFQAVAAMQNNPKHFSYMDWYMWYVADEFGAELFEQGGRTSLYQASWSSRR